MRLLGSGGDLDYYNRVISLLFVSVSYTLREIAQTATSFSRDSSVLLAFSRVCSLYLPWESLTFKPVMILMLIFKLCKLLLGHKQIYGLTLAASCNQ